jgi:PAS domain-containing protein
MQSEQRHVRNDMDDTGAFGTTGLRHYLSQGAAARSATAEPKARASRSAWIAMALASILYPAWRPLFVHSLPMDVDPVWERLAIGALSAVLLAISALPRFRRHVVAFSHLALYVTTLHFFTLVLRNDLADLYVAGLFLLLAATGMSFLRFRAFAFYSAFVLCLTLGVVANAPDRPIAGTFLLAGVITLQGMIGLLTWRNSIIQNAARESIRQTRDFLRAVIDGIPDPIFVDGERQERLLINQAMLAIDRRSILAQHLPAALAASEPIERELLVTDQDGQPRTVLVKLAARELLGGRRCVVGVVRDISERKALEHSLEAKIRELERERNKVKQLQGLLPICMHCGRIRDGGQWEELESYIESHSEAVFSHGLCQQCMSKHYPAEVG